MMSEQPTEHAIVISTRVAKTMRGTLLDIRRQIDAEALVLAAAPATWQVIAHALDWQKAPWFAPLPKEAQPWTPNFRVGHKRKSARDSLAALFAAKMACPEQETKQLLPACAKFLRENLTGDSLVRLRAAVQTIYRSVGRRQPEDWWNRLPIASPMYSAPGRFMDSAQKSGSGANYSNLSIGIVSTVSQPLLDRLNRFCEMQPNRLLAGGAEMAESVRTGQFFTVSGTISLTPEESASLRSRGLHIASTLVTAVPYADQDDPEKVIGHVAGHMEAEVLHDAHRQLGLKQIALLEALFEADFPLLYWRGLMGTAEPAEKLPDGRRMEFSAPECGALYEALSGINGKLKVSLSLDSVKRDPKIRAMLLTTAKGEAAYLAFHHVNALRLLAWVEAIPSILNLPTIADVLNGRSVAEAQLLAAHFKRAAEEILHIMGLLLARNHGLASTLHQRFVRYNSSFSGHDSRDVASLVREEMLKTIASFNFSTGLRFSTYAVNRINLELRRRPHQERQLIKLSPDQTTAQPRVYHLALESEFPETDPQFLADLSERYNELYGADGKMRLTAAQVGELLYVGKTSSLVIKSQDSEGESDRKLDYDWMEAASPAISDDDLAEAQSEVRAILAKFTPAEELALSVILQATPPTEALRRFNRSYMADSQARIGRIITSAAIKSSKFPPNDPPATVELKTQWGQAERAIRTRQSDEIARKDEQPEEDS
jgi:hypothetical protein